MPLSQNLVVHFWAHLTIFCGLQTHWIADFGFPVQIIEFL
jgi:hypothetical protein